MFFLKLMFYSIQLTLKEIHVLLGTDYLLPYVLTKPDMTGKLKPLTDRITLFKVLLKSLCL